MQLTRPDYLQLAEVEVFGVPLTGNTNFAPALSNPGEQSSSLNTSVDLALVAVDPDGDLLSFAATGLPPGLVIDTASGAVTGSPTSAGNFNVQASVSDGVEQPALVSTGQCLTVCRQPTSRWAVLRVSRRCLRTSRSLRRIVPLMAIANGEFEAGSLTHTDLDAEAWWEVDLGASYNLQRVELYNRTDAVQSL